MIPGEVRGPGPGRRITLAGERVERLGRRAELARGEQLERGLPPGRQLGRRRRGRFGFRLCFGFGRAFLARVAGSDLAGGGLDRGRARLR